ncbi:hypothetical protein FRX31_011999 [Thalictrum thalictroides]|uniref:Uncharacterized protein n=1 Tax=Thalictrum thalictroides TaxID=46969 RepID=A0A7J6WM30_THATH|nr:hypothetical protein FRX31_011999 [Thalictrum thalictroides]
MRKDHCGKGIKIQFWQDRWLGDTQLRYQFPLIYKLTTTKMKRVSDLGHSSNKNVTWNLRLRRYFNDTEAIELEGLMVRLSNVVFEEGANYLSWDGEKGGQFTVKSMFKRLQEVERSPT